MNTRKESPFPGGMKSSQALRECSKCGDVKPPEGGVEMGPGRWRCAGCWKSLRRKQQ